jgi:ubiquinone/menaquinone biosynthesis C-methylase UbiE/uncharacterized protein YbaR (Trm112 family)
MELLCCPDCLAPLASPRGDLACADCGRTVEVREGVVRLLREQGERPLNRRFRLFYDGLSPMYDRMEPLFARAFGGKDSARGDVLAPLRFEPGMRVLDVGIGTGTMVEHYPVPPDELTVYGVDLSWGQVVRARRKFDRRGTPCALAQAAAEQLPFADQTFDVVYHMGGINFFSSPRRAVEEMIRVSRPGATLSIVDETPDVVTWARIFSRVGLPAIDRAALRLIWGGAEAETAFIDGSDRDPAGWVPDGMIDLRFDDVWNGRGLRVSFSTPS